MSGPNDFPAASYDAWKTTPPEDESEPDDESGGGWDWQDMDEWDWQDFFEEGAK